MRNPPPGTTEVLDYSVVSRTQAPSTPGKRRRDSDRTGPAAREGSIDHGAGLRPIWGDSGKIHPALTPVKITPKISHMRSARRSTGRSPRRRFPWAGCYLNHAAVRDEKTVDGYFG